MAAAEAEALWFTSSNCERGP